jgi:hypothetical protein
MARTIRTFRSRSAAEPQLPKAAASAKSSATNNTVSSPRKSPRINSSQALSRNVNNNVGRHATPSPGSQSKAKKKATTNEPRTQLHYAALRSDKKITEDHVYQVLGVGEYSPDEIASTIKQWNTWKTDCRGWVAEEIKREMVICIRSLKRKDERFKNWSPAKTSLGQDICTYDDIRKWWKMNGDEEQNQMALFEVCYGHWDKMEGWDVQWEEKYMERFKFEYIQDSKDALIKKCKRTGYTTKGCIARNFTQVKVELVKNFQKAGKSAKHGCVVTKSRQHDVAYGDDGAYKRRKKEDFTVSVSMKHKEDEPVRIFLLLFLFLSLLQGN